MKESCTIVTAVEAAETVVEMAIEDQGLMIEILLLMTVVPMKFFPHPTMELTMTTTRDFHHLMTSS
jgi:hypothetical protein